MHVLDADNLLPELDAAKFSATKVTQDPATIVKQKAKINKGIYAVTVITLDCGSTQRKRLTAAPAEQGRKVVGVTYLSWKLSELKKL